MLYDASSTEYARQPVCQRDNDDEEERSYPQCTGLSWAPGLHTARSRLEADGRPAELH